MKGTLIFVLGFLAGLAIYAPHNRAAHYLFSRGDDARFEGKPRYREWKGGVEQ